MSGKHKVFVTGPAWTHDAGKLVSTLTLCTKTFEASQGMPECVLETTGGAPAPSCDEKVC